MKISFDGKVKSEKYLSYIFTTILMFAIVYMYRLLSGSAIVVFEPENNIL